MKPMPWRLAAAGIMAVVSGWPALAELPARQAAAKPSVAKPAETVETVAVGGCLKEGPAGTWALSSASAPVASTANAPSPKELAEVPRNGTAEFRLIGVGIFNLPSHRNHAVVVKGLLIKAIPVSRINVTSLTMVSDTCPVKP